MSPSFKEEFEKRQALFDVGECDLIPLREQEGVYEEDLEIIRAFAQNLWEAFADYSYIRNLAQAARMRAAGQLNALKV